MVLVMLKKFIKHLILINRYSNSKIYYGASMDKDSSIGKRVVLFKDVFLQNTQIDNYSYVQASSTLVCAKISKFCSIASNVFIGLPEHPTDMVSTSPVFYDNTQPLPFFFIRQREFEFNTKTTTINSDVWIGQNAMIKAGVNIGVGAIVGAGAVVTKDVEPYSIVGGVPAKHIKYRFENEIREKLIASKWWMLDEEKLEKLSKYFKSPEEFIESIY